MEDSLTICEKFKEQGNTSLKDNHFDAAVEAYTKAIDTALTQGNTFPNNKIAIYYANRAFANIKLENYGLAIPDAEASIQQNPQYEKAYMRLAFAKEVVQAYKEAYAAYLKVPTCIDLGLRTVRQKGPDHPPEATGVQETKLRADKEQATDDAAR